MHAMHGWGKNKYGLWYCSCHRSLFFTLARWASTRHVFHFILFYFYSNIKYIFLKYWFFSAFFEHILRFSVRLGNIIFQKSAKYFPMHFASFSFFSELREGISLLDDKGNEVGTSKKVAIRAISMVTLCRIAMVTPVLGWFCWFFVLWSSFLGFI